MTGSLGLTIQGNQEQAEVLQSMPPLEPCMNVQMILVIHACMHACIMHAENATENRGPKENHGLLDVPHLHPG